VRKTDTQQLFLVCNNCLISSGYYFVSQSQKRLWCNNETYEIIFNFVEIE